MEYGLIGEHLSHSFSAEIHPKLQNYTYELKEIAKEDLDAFMKARDFKAINVTIPYKQDVIPYLSFIDPAAKEIGAVNTVVNKDGQLYGYNTDYLGMKKLIEKNGIDIQGKKVLILGSGGTAKTATAVAKTLGAARINCVSRSGKDGCVTYEYAKEMLSDTQVIINTTPVGMYPEIGKAVIDLDDYPETEGVVDAIFNPIRSALVQRALEKGIKATGGLYMLVAQAVYASEYFTGNEIPKERIDEVYSELLASKENIVLIGMPGCGKSTVGKHLREARNMELIDTDKLIVEREGKPITQIFDEIGEEGFRDIESAVIKEVAKLSHVIISTGGGAILRRENISILKENGKTVFLDCPLSILKATESRPLSNTADKLKQRYDERYDIYLSLGDIRIECGNDFKENAEVARKEIENAYSSN